MRYSLLMAAILLSACSTTPDPAEVCTSEWIAPRVDQAVDRIETRLEKALKAFRSVAESRLSGKTPGPIQMFRLSNAAKALEKELENGRGIKDLRVIAATCNDPDLIQDQIFALLKREGLSDGQIDFLDTIGILDRLIRTAEGVQPSAPDG
ncbi:hypothetical protein GCM10007853_13360 [Algimonas ampicilliniresistens]|uniref:Lipoprotein n=1 Tax=Algimonas ampicilliniresistens TaxID=1298735 RepID=A0ABQ5V8W3_9PROT|nr:hypothetical protein [Algimonas ampicilliniresistens]GLQ23462.1 hypothetical protein GCM10007853_13360 [Algimonas ampicilliniresistens]